MLNPPCSLPERRHPGTAQRRTLRAGAVAAVTAVALLAPTLPAIAAEDAPQAMTQERIDQANNAVNASAATLEFITMSDTELSGSATAEKSAEQVAYEGAKPHFEKLGAWAKKQGFDPQVVIDNGDVVGANDPEYNDHQAGKGEKTAGWYRAVERVMRETFPESQVLMTQGNHDIADLMGKTLDEARAAHAPEGPEWFYPKAEDGYVGNFHTTVNGIDFIGLDYNGTHTFGYGGQRTGYQDFLKRTLVSITAKPGYDAAKPIFVNIHSGYAGTSLGGPFHGDYDLAGPDLQRILADYPQAVLGSAHTHFSSNPETSIFQKDFTVYENASMNYIYQDVPGGFLGGGYFEGNQGDPENGVSQKSANFISVLEDGTTVIRRFDVTHQRWMGMPWVVDTSQGTAGFTYTKDQRSTTAPWWEGAKITGRNATETSVTLGFDQAKDDELVNYYQVTIADQAGNPVPFTANQVPDFGKNPAKSFTGSFKAYSRFYMTPNTMGFDIAGLKPAKTYRAQVSAVDDFGNTSEVLAGSFRTAGTLVFPEYPDSPVAAPEGEFLNLPFEGTLADTGEAAATAPVPAPVGQVSFVDSDRAGATGQAVRIGAGAKSYVDLGSRPEFDLGTDKNLTMSFWAKVTGVNGYGAIISNKNWANFYRAGVNLAPQSSDTGKLEFSLGDGTNGVYATGPVPNFKDSWHQMTVTVDRATNLARTYQDGALVGENSIASVGSMTSGLNMLVGVDGSKSYGVGLDMDDLKMWDSALSADEVQALFAADDRTAEVDALGRALEYSTELVSAQEVEAANGRVLDPALTRGLGTAIDSARALLAEAAPEKEQLRAGYDGLRAAVSAAEGQAARYAYTASASNGTISPAEGVADLAGEIRFALTPATGFQIEQAAVEVTGAESFAVTGAELVLSGVQGRAEARVAFAPVEGGESDGSTDGDGQPDGTTDGQTDGAADGVADGSVDGQADGGTDVTDGTADGASDVVDGETPKTPAPAKPAPGDALAATGGESAQSWFLAALATVLLGAAGVVLGLRSRLRTR